MEDEFEQPEMRTDEQTEPEPQTEENPEYQEPEYDESGELIEPQNEEETPPETAAEPPAYTPPAYAPPQGELPEEAYLREQFGDEAISAINRLVDAKVSAATQAMAAASAHVSVDAAENPELFRVHGARINQMLPLLPANQRGTKEGLNLIKAHIILEEAQASGDFNGALQRMAALSGKNKAQPPAMQAQPRKVVPPSQRPPARSAGGAPERGSDTRAGSGFLAKRFGLRADLARDILDDIQE